MTGYGFALPKKSKYLQKFNEKMIEYRENGTLFLNLGHYKIFRKVTLEFMAI